MPLKIYYLDDEPALCEIFSDTVSSAEIHVETFQDPKALIERSESVKPDMIFMDYRLPGITGDEVAQKLDAGIPKVLVTGDLQVKTNYQFIAYLEKPTKEEDIQALIAKHAPPRTA